MSRGPVAIAVASQMQDEDVLDFAGAWDDEFGKAFTADPTSGTVTFMEGPH
jgi:hypothetical protein